MWASRKWYKKRLKQENIFLALLKKVELVLPVEKAKSFTVGSDETINIAERSKYVEQNDLKTAKAKSVRKEIRKPCSGAAIRQTVSQKQAQRSDKLDDDRMLPLCSAQVIYFFRQTENMHFMQLHLLEEWRVVMFSALTNIATFLISE